MYKMLFDLFKEGKITEENLEDAVTRGWISRIEKMQMISTVKLNI